MKSLSPFFKVTFFVVFFAFIGCSTDRIGKITLAGNSPYTYVLLKSTSGPSYQIVGPLAREIQRHYKDRQLRIKGNIVKESLSPGFPAQFEATSFTALD